MESTFLAAARLRPPFADREAVDLLAQLMIKSVMHWLLRILMWDGVLPAALLILPILVRLTVPQLPEAVVVVAVVLPIAAFFLRLYIGCCHIAANFCGSILRRLQSAALMLGILALMFIDATLIGLQGIPGDPIWRNPDELIVLGGIYLFYLTCMAVALYPGHRGGETVASGLWLIQRGEP